MKFIADFHIHSHFSIATSKQLCPEYLDLWARIKGIQVVGTGDFTHPGWTKELMEKLEPAEEGLFRLKNEYRRDPPFAFKAPPETAVRFMLTAEISSIYKKGNTTRKVHNVVFAPDFGTVEEIQRSLEKIGNITSDGRPILGLDSRDLLEICLEASDRILFVPAHIWTPWFSALGAKSGFDTIEGCYGDLSDHIFTVETGLSSDPPMNWMCSFLDRFTLLSNSDAHSPEKLGREANLFDTDISYEAIIQTIKSGDRDRCLGTIEFFPQEGKYHFDGHRKCNVCWNPVETLKHREICPVCGKKVTVGVMNRVVQLSDRETIPEHKKRIPFHSLVPLKEILSEMLDVGPNTKQVTQLYHSILQKAGSEFDVLLHLPLEEIKTAGGDLLAEALRRMRSREVFIQEGYDGEYGVIKMFHEKERKSFSSQDSFFIDSHVKQAEKFQPRSLIPFDLEEYQALRKKMDYSDNQPHKPEEEAPETDFMKELNPEQRDAVLHESGPALVLAGPGTGKTRVLTARILHLVQNKKIPPENILAVTFTNKAAGEMKGRLGTILGRDGEKTFPRISTFHAFGYDLLKKYAKEFNRSAPFTIADEEDRQWLLKNNLDCPQKNIKALSRTIGQIKALNEAREKDSATGELFTRYESLLEENNAFDLDDLIVKPVQLFLSNPEILDAVKKQFPWILVDEYQDINLVQYRLLRTLLPGSDASLFAVGDPNQSIYGFRGADVRFIQTFLEDYPRAGVYPLKISYRCSNRILKASHNIISSVDRNKKTTDEIRVANPETRFPIPEPRSPKSENRTPILEGLQEGVKIKIVSQPTDKSEAEFIARTIEQMMGGLRFFSMDSDITLGNESRFDSLSEFAVLCRTGRQMDAIEKAFHDHSIPYQTVGETSFFMKEPVKPVMALLKSALNPKNRWFQSKLKTGEAEFPFRTHTGQEKSVKELVEEAIRTLYQSDRDNDDSFRKLLNLTESFGTDLEAFIKHASLGAPIDACLPNVERVNLMTLHAAKGLEFSCVFIAGCEEGLIPYALFENQKADLEEERRLLYVGMTRARSFLFLSHAEKRFLHGREMRLERSRFMDAIEKELMELSKGDYKRKSPKKENQLGLF